MESGADGAKIGAYLKEKRLAFGWSAEELAEKIGVGTYEVNAWETGFPPEVRYLLPLSRALGVSVEEILRGEDAPKEASTPPAPFKPTPLPLPEETPVPSPMPEKREKSYYDTLQENMKTTDESGKPYATENDNGFSAGERKFGYILCSVFIAVVLLVQIVGAVSAHNRYVRRDRELTLENYTEYILLSVTGVGNFNVDEYDISVTALKKITDFKMTVEVTFSGALIGKESVGKTLNFQGGTFAPGDTLTERIMLESFYYIQNSYEVLSVSGGLE